MREAADTVTAVRLATAQRSAVRIAKLTTENRVVEAQPDGAMTATLSAGPVRARKGGKWLDVDTTLVRRADGAIVPRVALAEYEFSGGGTGAPLVRYGKDGARLALSWPGRLPAAVIDGSTATYPEVLPGVDLMLRAEVDGYAHHLVVKNAKAARNPALHRIKLGLTTKGVRVSASRSGVLEAKDAKGRALFRTPPAQMWDAADKPRRAAVGVAVGRGALTLTPDRALLTGPKTEYPVVVDPDWRTYWNVGWTKVFSGPANSTHWGGGNDVDGWAKVGYCGWAGCNGIGTARSYFMFDTGFLAGKRIISAGLNATIVYGPSCNTRNHQLFMANAGVGGGTSWNNAPQGWHVGTAEAASNYSGCGGNKGIGFNVLGNVNTAGISTYFLKAENEGDAYAWRKYDANATHVVVNYNTSPNAPYDLGTDPPLRPCRWCDGTPYVGDERIRLQTRLSDPDNDGVKPIWDIYGGGSAEHRDWGPWQGSGAFFSTDLDLRERHGQHVTWTAWASDGHDGGPWASGPGFIVDRVGVDQPPTVSAPLYQDDNRWHGGVDVPDTFTFTASGVADIDHYRYGWQDPPSTNVDASALGGPASVTLTPPGDGPRTLYVQSVDRAGNASPTKAYRIYVRAGSGPLAQWSLDGNTKDTAFLGDRDGTLAGGTSYQAGAAGLGLRVAAATGGQLTAPTTVRTDASFSVAAWVKLDKVDDKWQGVVRQEGANECAFCLQYQGRDKRFVFVMPQGDSKSPPGYDFVVAPAEPVAGQWTHLAGVYDAAAKKVRLYVDGVLVGSATRERSWHGAGPLAVGKGLTGMVDEVRMYDRVLSDTEVRAAVSQENVQVGHWKLDDQEGTTAANAAPGGEAAVLQPGAAFVREGLINGAARFDGNKGFAATTGPAVRTGRPGDPSGPIGKTEQRFYRGMHGDKLPSGTRPATVQPSEGQARTDEDWLQGVPLESITYDGDTDRVVSKTIEEPSWQGPTATRGSLKAYLVRNGATQSYTALAAGGWRTTRTESTYDDRGLPTRTNDLGDTATTADDRCTRVWYARNTGRWLLNFPYRTETVGVDCGTEASFPKDAISDVRVAYDGQDLEAAPVTGNATRTEALSEAPAEGRKYVLTSTAKYDVHGRVVEAADALGRASKTAYTPETGGPVTQLVTTNALGHATTTTLHPAWGQPTIVVDANKRRTETAYDALGRVVEVWQPSRPRVVDGVDYEGSVKFAYLVRDDAPSVVTTTGLGPNGNYVTTKVMYDGMLRPRQTQRPAGGGGRLLTDTRYDSQGRAYRTTQPYFNDAAIDDKLWVASDTEVPGLSTTLFDGAGRTVAQTYQSGGSERWRTTTAYGGDRVHVTPPAGGMASTTISDARGQTVELRQYHGGTPSGEYDTTRYAYTTAGRLASVTDPAGNTWRYGYDLRGNQIRADDPDKGVSTMEYDAAGQLVAATDARDVKLTYGHDPLGRRTSVKRGATTLAGWTYDTATKGKGRLASSVRYLDGAAYVRQVTGYSPLYQPTAATVEIPEAEETLSGSYTTHYSYNADGSPNGVTLPALGGLPKETVSFEYDDLGAMRTMSGGLDEAGTARYVTGTEYTRYGELARLQLGDDGKRVWQSYYYEDSTRRLSRTIMDAELPRAMQNDVHYTYDPSGNVLSLADTPKDGQADRQCFRYDHVRRLTHAWTPEGGCDADPAVGDLSGPAPYWQSFTYDAVGNRLTETQHAAAGDTLRKYAYSAAGAHDLTAVATAGPAGTKTDEYAYDATGNTVKRPGQSLAWDAEGELAKVTEGDKVTEYSYDADGNRLVRRDPTGRTLYLAGQEVRLDAASGKKTATRYYRYGSATVAVRTAAGVRWLAGDHQGTAQLTVDSASQAVTQRRQTPFGTARGTAVTWPVERGFVGGIPDAATGLTQLGAREYDPGIGRFISVDPLMSLTDPQQMQAYSYADNSPVTMSDPTGLAPSCPDGDCRNGKGPAGKSSTPAKQTDFPRSCPDGYGSCYAAGGWIRPPAEPVAKSPKDRARDEHAARRQFRRMPVDEPPKGSVNRVRPTREPKEPPLILRCTSFGGQAVVAVGVEECRSSKEPGKVLYSAKIGAGPGEGVTGGVTIKSVDDAKDLDDATGWGWVVEGGAGVGPLNGGISFGSSFGEEGFTQFNGGIGGTLADPTFVGSWRFGAGASAGVEYGWVCPDNNRMCAPPYPLPNPIHPEYQGPITYGDADSGIVPGL